MKSKRTLRAAALIVLLAVLVCGWSKPTEALGCPYIYERAAPVCDDGNPYNGYWWYGEWVPGYPTIETWMTPAPDWFVGAAVRYAPGVMEATAEHNGLSLRGYLDGVAIPNCGDKGREVWLNPGGGWEGPYLVADCTRLGDLYGVVRYRGVAVEVGYRTALRWGLADRLDGVQVRTSFYGGQNRPARYDWWWLGILTFTEQPERRPIWMGEGWIRRDQLTVLPEGNNLMSEEGS